MEHARRRLGLETIKTRHGNVPGLGLKEVTGWIEQAKAWKE